MAIPRRVQDRTIRAVEDRRNSKAILGSSELRYRTDSTRPEYLGPCSEAVSPKSEMSSER